MTQASVLNVPNKNKRIRRDKTDREPIRNVELYAAFLASKEAGCMTKEFATMLHNLVDRYSYHPNFANYSFREDMVAHAMMVLCDKWQKFDPEYYLSVGQKPNLFAYYTTCAYRAFLFCLAAEKKERTIRDELLLDCGMQPSWNYNLGDGKTAGWMDSDASAFGTNV